MKIPADAIIPDAKITHYLLVLKLEDDKSKFLAQAGFTLENSKLLKSAEAVEDRKNQFGTFYQVGGTLKGINDCNLSVVTV